MGLNRLSRPPHSSGLGHDPLDSWCGASGVTCHALTTALGPLWKCGRALPTPPRPGFGCRASTVEEEGRRLESSPVQDQEGPKVMESRGEETSSQEAVQRGSCAIASG